MENVYGVNCKISYVAKGKKVKKAFTFSHRHGECTIIGRRYAQKAILDMLYNDKPTFEEYIEMEKKKQEEKDKLKSQG